MDFRTRHIRNLVCCLHFLSVALWFFYLYFKLWEFISAAALLHFANVQIICFILYSFLLVLFPAAIIYSPKYKSKKKIFMSICFSLSAVILVGAIADLFTYGFFHRYTFTLGDAVFCNILIGVPNLYGTICCILLSTAYLLFGKYFTEKKLISCLLYLFIILIGVVPAFIFSFNTWGTFPRPTWIEKAAFIGPHQACLLLSFILSATSDVIWDEFIR